MKKFRCFIRITFMCFIIMIDYFSFIKYIFFSYFIISISLYSHIFLIKIYTQRLLLSSRYSTLVEWSASNFEIFPCKYNDKEKIS